MSPGIGRKHTSSHPDAAAAMRLHAFLTPLLPGIFIKSPRFTRFVLPIDQRRRQLGFYDRGRGRPMRQRRGSR